MVLVVLVLSNIGINYYLYKVFKECEKKLLYEVQSLSNDIARFTQYAEAYQSLQDDYVRNLQEHITIMCKEGDEYRNAVNKVIKDIPKEIVIKNVLNI